MHWLCKPSPAVRTHHLHLVPMASRLWNERLAFRDALRADENLRAEYRILKLTLADEHRNDREAYTDAKAPFIYRVLERAAKGGAHAAERVNRRGRPRGGLCSPMARRSCPTSGFTLIV